MAKDREEHQRIDVYEEYNKIPLREIEQLAEEKVLPNKRLAEMWHFTFPFFNRVLEGKITDQDILKKEQMLAKIEHSLSGTGNYFDGTIAVSADAAEADRPSISSDTSQGAHGLNIHRYLLDHFWPLYFSLKVKRDRYPARPLKDLLEALAKKHETRYTEEDGTEVYESVDSHNPDYEFTYVHKSPHSGPAYFGFRFNFYDSFADTPGLFEEIVQHHKNWWIFYNLKMIQSGGARKAETGFGHLDPGYVMDSQHSLSPPLYRTAVILNHPGLETPVETELSLTERFQKKAYRVAEKVLQLDKSIHGEGSADFGTILNYTVGALFKMATSFHLDEEAMLPEQISKFVAQVDNLLRFRTIDFLQYDDEYKTDRQKDAIHGADSLGSEAAETCGDLGIDCQGLLLSELFDQEKDEKDRQIIIGLTDGKTLEEIGRELGITHQAVSKRRAKIRDRFARELGITVKGSADNSEEE